MCTSLYCGECTALTSLPNLPLCTELDCYGCTSLTSLPDLLVCTILYCYCCTSLISLPDLPVCTELRCGNTLLTSLPDLPVCTALWCNELPHLTHITVPDNCKVLCYKSPISGYNNDIYLSYTNERNNIISSSINNSHNYEQGIVSIIVGYL
jgi:hypothetical protein